MLKRFALALLFVHLGVFSTAMSCASALKRSGSSAVTA
jgi:hypothetical protein